MPTGVRKRLGEPKGQRPGVSVAPCESRSLALGAANAILIAKNPSLASGWSYEWDGVPPDRRVWKEHAVPFRESTGPVVFICTGTLYESVVPPWRLELPMSGSKIPEDVRVALRDASNSNLTTIPPYLCKIHML